MFDTYYSATALFSAAMSIDWVAEYDEPGLFN